MNEKGRVSVAVIDDNELFREGIKKILNNTAIFDIVFEGYEIDQILTSSICQPDILLFDQIIYEKVPLEKMQRLLDRYPTAKLGLFITDIHSHEVSKGFALNVLGYLTKNMKVEVFTEALEEIYRNRHWVHPHMVDDLLKAYKQLIIQVKAGGHKEAVNRPLHLLSKRECEVLELLANGYKNREISTILGVTESTIKNHVTNILVKLNVNDRTQAVIMAIRHRWVDIDIESKKHYPGEEGKETIQ